MKALKAYLVTTGTLFGLLAVLHLWRVVEMWHRLATDPWFVLGATGITVVAGALCLWAWRLLWTSARS
jgi:multisubunit Na+/H+ antiporter MnhG subunit